MTSSSRRSPAVGEYLVQLYVLLKEGRPVVGARLAERMGVSPPAVTQALRRMARDGLVTIDRRRGAGLTQEGKRQAETTIRRHYLVERLLVDVLGCDWAEVHEDADLLEHALSPRLEARLYERLGHPTTCPHGNPFPGSPDEQRLAQARRLTEARPGEEVAILRVSEEAEGDFDLMHFLSTHYLLPGVKATVQSPEPGSDHLVLQTARGLVKMPVGLANRVRIA